MEGLEGVKRASASHPEKKAVVVYDPELVTPEQMRQALIKVGYIVSMGNHEKQDILNPILEKDGEFKRDGLVCYCFEFTRNDIEQDVIQNGRSRIMAKIAAEKKSGGCDCANKNPKGR